MSPWLTVFIPAYNEEANLPQSLPTLLAQLDALRLTAEILVVDDGSRDATPAVIADWERRDPRVRGLRHNRNRGLGRGLRTALEAARGEWLILIPADLALEPTELPKYFAAAAHADIVVGRRSDRRDYSPFRRLVSWVNIRAIQWLFGTRLQQFNYISFYRLTVLRAVAPQYVDSAFFFAEILLKAQARGYALTEVDIAYRPRRDGQATGARWPLIAHTAHDMLHFWLTRHHS